MRRPPPVDQVAPEGATATAMLKAFGAWLFCFGGV
jgi:hypothetical protein